MSLETGARTVVILATLLSMPAALFAADEDPFVGTWKLNVSKSKYNPGPPPKETRYLKFEPLGNGAMKVTIFASDANGKSIHHEVRMEKYDGKRHPLEADPSIAEEGSERRLDAYTQAVENWRKGQVVTRLTRTVSKDGKTLTLRAKGTTASGQSFDDVRVYDQQ